MGVNIHLCKVNIFDLANKHICCSKLMFAFTKCQSSEKVSTLNKNKFKKLTKNILLCVWKQKVDLNNYKMAVKLDFTTLEKAT